MSDLSPIIVWFRQDLRLADNLAFLAALDTGHPILPVYVLDDGNAGSWAMGGASRWWLHHSLVSLNESLEDGLFFQKGNPQDVLNALIADHNAQGVYWNRCYEPWQIARDKKIKEELKVKQLDVRSFNSTLLYEPCQTLKDDGTPYKVFTPFFKKACLQKNGDPPVPDVEPQNYDLYTVKGDPLGSLDLLPEYPWANEIAALWKPGERGARIRLNEFLDAGLDDYKEGRNHPARDNVSRLSPHLHFGEISPRTVWYAVKQRMSAEGLEKDGEHFLSELGWREFSYNLLYHFPELPQKNLQEKFDCFPWRTDDGALRRWQKGQTGVPIVDAGMRELWRTGYMHNRVRMIVGSFLVKNLMLHWHHGEKWFWDTLLDADLANNSAGWQWVAGCGADAAPYFRIFNPVLQGEKFDPEGKYVREYVPEISALPDKYLHKPWEAPHDVIADAGIVLGDTYPKPLVNLKDSRDRALAVFKAL